MEYITFIVFAGVMGYMAYRQQQTIDRLTDKLMAKDYSEYKRNNNVTVTEERQSRKPMSYYDDPSIELEE